MEFRLSKEDLKGFEVDLNSFIDEFVFKVADGAPLNFATFKKLWEARNMSFVVATPLDLRNLPQHIQSVFMTILDRIDRPSPLIHTVKRRGRPKQGKPASECSTNPLANIGNLAGGTEDEIIANLVEGAGFEGFQGGDGEGGNDRLSTMNALLQQTAQAVGSEKLDLANQSDGGAVSVGNIQQFQEARDVDRWGEMVNDALAANPVQSGIPNAMVRNTQMMSGGPKGSDYSRDVDRDPRRTLDGAYNLESQPGSQSMLPRPVDCPASVGGIEGPHRSMGKAESVGSEGVCRNSSPSDRMLPGVSDGGEAVQVAPESDAGAQPTLSGKVSNSSAGIESLLARAMPRGDAPGGDMLPDLGQDFDTKVGEMETTLAEADLMVQGQPPNGTEDGPLDDENMSWPGGMSDIGHEFDFVVNGLEAAAVGSCPNQAPIDGLDHGESIQEGGPIPDELPYPSMSSGSLNLSEIARQMMDGEQQHYQNLPTLSMSFSGDDEGPEGLDTRFKLPNRLAKPHNPSFNRNLDCWVPLEAKVAAVFAVYVCYKVQFLRPKSMIHVPYTTLSSIVAMLPELHARGLWDCLKILKTLVVEDAFAFGIFRRPPPGQGIPTPLDESEINMGCELILHMKTTLKGACNPSGIQLHCKRYDEARSLLAKLGDWTCGLIGREGTTEALFDCSLGTRLDRIISEQQHLMQECVASKDIKHDKRGFTEIKDLHQKSLARLHDWGPWQKDLGINPGPSKRWLMIEQNAKEVAAERRMKLREKEMERAERKRWKERSEKEQMARWKLSPSEVEELKMLKGMPKGARAAVLQDFEKRHMARLGLEYTPPVHFKKPSAASKRSQPASGPSKSMKIKKKRVVPFPVQKAAAPGGDSKHLIANTRRTQPLDIDIERDLSELDGIFYKRSGQKKSPPLGATECDNLNSVSDADRNEAVEGPGPLVEGKDGADPSESNGKRQANGGCQENAEQEDLEGSEEEDSLQRDVDRTLQDIDRILDEEMALDH